MKVVRAKDPAREHALIRVELMTFFPPVATKPIRMLNCNLVWPNGDWMYSRTTLD